MSRHINLKNEISSYTSAGPNVLNQFKKTDFMTYAVKNFFPDAKHKLISSGEVIITGLGNCHERIGYFYLSGGLPIIYTDIKISLDRTSNNLIEELKIQKKPYGELLRDYYPKSVIESETISFEENTLLPSCYLHLSQSKVVSRHERYIVVDGEKVAIAVEYI